MRNAWIHDTELGTTKRIPSLDGRPRAPVVDEVEGQVYFVRSGQACGANVRIMRVPADDMAAAPVTLTTFPDGVDVGFTLFPVRPAGQIDLWFCTVPVRTAAGRPLPDCATSGFA